MQEYYQECIKGKDIPKDAPEYFKKALKKAKKEYEKGIILEKSLLSNFAEKYTIEGKPGIIPRDYFEEKFQQIKDFLGKHLRTKVLMILICEMEKQVNYKNMASIKTFIHDKAYFRSGTHINHEIEDIKVIMKEMINETLKKLSEYLKNGSGWYFKEVISLEIHLVENKPMKGGTYIPLPKFIQNKNAIISLQNEDDKCFVWSVLRYLHPKEIHGERINDLKKYENELNFKDIKFPIKLKDIKKFEKQHPNLPRIGVFSIDEDNKINPLRLKKNRL